MDKTTHYTLLLYYLDERLYSLWHFLHTGAPFVDRYSQKKIRPEEGADCGDHPTLGSVWKEQHCSFVTLIINIFLQLPVLDIDCQHIPPEKEKQ